MMEATGTSETLVNLHQTTGRSNPEDSHLHLIRFCPSVFAQLFLYVQIVAASC
jgi:hypothetical protein